MVRKPGVFEGLCGPARASLPSCAGSSGFTTIRTTWPRCSSSSNGRHSSPRKRAIQRDEQTIEHWRLKTWPQIQKSVGPAATDWFCRRVRLLSGPWTGTLWHCRRERLPNSFGASAGRCARAMAGCRRLLTEYPEVVNGLDRPGLVHAALVIEKGNVGFARGLLQAAGVGQVLRSSLGIVCACGAGTSARVSTSGPPARSMM